MPEPVTNNAVCEGFVADTGYVYSFAGLDSTKLYSGIHLKSWRYNTVTDVWESLPNVPDTLGKIAASASRVGNIIYLIGGYHVYADGNEKSSNLVHRFDIVSNAWLPNAANIPVPIDDQVQGVWRDSLIYVVTGWSDVANVPNVQIYNPSLDLWVAGTPTPDNTFYKAFGAAGYIYEDTIYYFGGAAGGQNFPIQKQLRKGIIDPVNPTQITWSTKVLQNGLAGYRIGAVRVKEYVHWIGGSDLTYNYDGLAYNGSGGVLPSGLNLYFKPSGNLLSTEYTPGLPMDIRGVGELSDEIKILVGGMQHAQQVSDQTLRLTYVNRIRNSVQKELQPKIGAVLTSKRDTILLTADAAPLAEVEVVITNVEGRQVSIQKSSPDGAVHLGDLPAGVYFLTLRTRGYEYVLKVRK